jgi:hypothetical protein
MVFRLQFLVQQHIMLEVEAVDVKLEVLEQRRHMAQEDWVEVEAPPLEPQAQPTVAAVELEALEVTLVMLQEERVVQAL